MSDTAFLKELVLCICLSIGGMSDIFRGSVRNVLLILAFAAIAGIRLMGKEGLLVPLAVAALTMAASFPLFRKRLMGAADIKLFALILFAFPSFFGLEILFISFLTALLHTALRLIRQGCGRGHRRARAIWAKGRGGHGVPLVPYLLFGTIIRSVI